MALAALEEMLLEPLQSHLSWLTWHKDCVKDLSLWNIQAGEDACCAKPAQQAAWL